MCLQVCSIHRHCSRPSRFQDSKAVERSKQISYWIIVLAAMILTLLLLPDPWPSQSYAAEISMSGDEAGCKEKQKQKQKAEEKRRGLSIDYSLLEKSLGRENRHVITWDSMMRWRDNPSTATSPNPLLFPSELQLHNVNSANQRYQPLCNISNDTSPSIHKMVWYADLACNAICIHAHAHSCQMMRGGCGGKARQKPWLFALSWFFGTVILFCNK